MPTPQLQELLGLMAECCALARTIRARLRPSDSETKADRSPVSVGDFAIQAWVARYLARQGQGLPLLGEETAAALALQTPALRKAVVDALSGLAPGVDEALSLAWLQAMERGPDSASLADYWTLDPIDGTRAYLKCGQYAIALAEVRAGTPVLGLLGCPALPDEGIPGTGGTPEGHGCILHATRGTGAWQLPVDGSPTGLRRIHVRPPGQTPIRVAESYAAEHGHQGLLDDWARTRGRELQAIRIDSQCKYALLARGDIDVYIRKPRRADYQEWVWDHAAGALIAEEAGAVVSDLAGRALDFARGQHLRGNHGILAAEPTLHAELRHFLNPP